MAEAKAALAPVIAKMDEIHSALSLLMDGEKLLVGDKPPPLSPSDKGAYKMSRLLNRDLANLAPLLDNPSVTLTVKPGERRKG